MRKLTVPLPDDVLEYFRNEGRRGGNRVAAVQKPRAPLPDEVLEFFRKAGKRGGELGGALGGKLVAANMTAAARKARARKAGLARWQGPRRDG